MKKWDRDCINLPCASQAQNDGEERDKERENRKKNQRHIFFHTADVNILCINSLDLGILPCLHTNKKSVDRMGILTFYVFT